MSSDQIFSTVLISILAIFVASGLIYFMKITLEDNPLKKQKN